MMPVRSADPLAGRKPHLEGQPTEIALPPRGGSAWHATQATPFSLHRLPQPQRPRRGLEALVEQAYVQLQSQDPAGALRSLEAAVGQLERPRQPRAQDGHGALVAAARPAPQQAQTRVVIHTLGSFEVRVDGQLLCTGRKHPRRTLALLKALIALGGRRVCRSTLVDVLWPDIDGDLGQNALEVTLHRLRTRLGVPDAIAARNGCLELDPEVVWVDALAFGAVAEDDAHAGASVSVDTAFSLYRGTFLPDDRDSSWSLRTRERLRARFVRIVTEAAALAEAVGRFDAAAALYERALAVDDLACVFHDGLARCLERLGRPSEARMAQERGTHLLEAAGCDPARA
jgi:DNA-binding SARP family transcriptional activator